MDDAPKMQVSQSVPTKPEVAKPPAATFTSPSAAASTSAPKSDFPPIGGGSDLPPIGGGGSSQFPPVGLGARGFGGGLGSIGSRQGGFEYDEEAKRRA